MHPLSLSLGTLSRHPLPTPSFALLLHTDDTAAVDNLHALEVFYAKFPEYKKNDLFITGESYAGVYVPTFAEAIVFAVQNGTYTGAPLKGIAVGNGCSGSEVGVCGGERTKYDAQYFAQSTAMLGPELQSRLNTHCDWENPKNTSAACAAAIAEMGPLLNRINIYNVYGECIKGTSDASPAVEGASRLTVLKAPVSHMKEGVQVGGPDACINSIEASNFMNQAALIKAIHVKPIAYRWSTCGSVAGWSYKSTRPNLPRDTYPLLLKNMRVLIYNGDWDACVPWTDNFAWTKGERQYWNYTGTILALVLVMFEYLSIQPPDMTRTGHHKPSWLCCINTHKHTQGMGFTAKDAWHPWTFNDLDAYGTQVGGYAVNYHLGKGDEKGEGDEGDVEGGAKGGAEVAEKGAGGALGFSFVTIRGGRHEVPETAPKRAFEMFSRLVAGETF